MAQLADKTGISRLSNQHTPEYLCKAKPAKYLCSRHKYLLLRVRSYTQIMLIIAVPPRSARARALPPQQVLHRGNRAASPGLSAPAGSLRRLHRGLPAPNSHFCALLPI